MRGAFRSHVRWLKRMGRKADKAVAGKAEAEAETASELQPA
jgi:hypothetical protein